MTLRWATLESTAYVTSAPTEALGSWQTLAWASKIWPTYAPLPRVTVLTYRDEGARVITEGTQAAGSGDATENVIYPRDNVFLGSQLLSSAVWSGTTPNYQFYAVDHLGTPRLVTDINANLVQTRKFWPFGDDGPTTGSDAGQRLKLAGMERDSETTHYYDHARTEDFSIGRFVSADRVFGYAENPQSWNRYSYVRDNPSTFVDPAGFTDKHAWWCDGPCPWLTSYLDLSNMFDGWWFGGSDAGGSSGPSIAGAALQKIKDALCSAIPDAHMIGASLSADVPVLGLGATGSGEILTNYHTGHVDWFLAGGPTAGLPNGVQGAVMEGDVWGIGADNSRYSGPFINTAATVYGPFGVFRSVSGHGPGGVVPSNEVSVTGFTLGASLLPGASATASVTYYGPPSPVSDTPLTIRDWLGFVAHNALCGE